ncbi:MAG: phosphonoacetaldehyde reductase [Myxococcota bacterium]
MGSSPTEVTFGWGAAQAFAESVAEGERILVCTTERMLGRFGAVFEALGRRAEVETATEQMDASSVDSVTALLERLRPLGPFARIVAIGGGSVLDTSKALAMGLAVEAPVRELIAEPDRFAEHATPIVAMPTTAGTGSEVTMWGTVWDLEARKKLSIAHPSLFPERAIVDPSLSATMPARLTAVTGFDALSHAMEVTWNVNHTAESDAWAREAIGLIVKHLPTAVATPGDREARAAMARAATIAGKGISVTKTAAAHSISYPLTLFHDVDHGIACSITLPALLRLNGESAPERTGLIVEALGAADAEGAAQTLGALFAACNMPMRLSELGVTADDLPRLLANAFTPARMANNVRALTEDDVRALLSGLV